MKYQHHALGVGQRALNQRFAVARVFVGQNVRFGHLRLIELPPNIVDANEHAHPIRVQIHYIRLPAGDQIAGLVQIQLQRNGKGNGRGLGGPVAGAVANFGEQLAVYIRLAVDLGILFAGAVDQCK